MIYLVDLVGCLALAAQANAFTNVFQTPNQNRIPRPTPSVPRFFSQECHSSSTQLSGMTSSLSKKVMETLPSKQVVDAVIDSKTDSIVASDVAASAGVGLSQARKDLATLASLSKGDIAVSSDGDLIYEFPKNLNTVLVSNSAKYRALQVFDKAWSVIYWMIRCSFGVAIVASTALVFATIAILLIAAAGSDDDSSSSSSSSRSNSSSNSIRFDVFDFSSGRSYRHSSRGRSKYSSGASPKGFLSSVFSYIFGDGNPNTDLEEERLKQATEIIRGNNCAVTAEILAPYCDPPEISEQDSSEAFVDESFVLPLVSQLGGEPQVSQDGDIIYVFSDLRVSTSPLPFMTKKKNPSALQEKEYRFSLASEEEKIFAGFLGIINLLGALYLGNLFQQYDLTKLNLGEFESFVIFVKAIYPGIKAYAISFNVIPLVRSVWIGVQNHRIQKRNKARQQWEEIVTSQDKGVLRKLKTAIGFGTRQKVVKSIDSVYNTKESFTDLQAKKGQGDLEEFDQRLNSDKR